MKALRRSHTGTLSLTETAVACSVNDLANDELLVMVAVASVNPADIKAGGSTPYSTGLDGAGIVIGVGGDDDTSLLGKRVTWHGPLREMRQGRPEYGSFGEYALVKKSAIVEIPEAMSFEVAATLPCPGGTATQVVDGLRNAIRDGGKKQAVFVQGAQGSVASIVVQLLKIRYPELLVIGSANPKVVQECSSDPTSIFHPIAYGEKELAELARVQASTGRALVGIVDSQGDTAQRNYDYLRDGGARQSVLVTVLSGPENLSQQGPTIYTIALGGAYDVAANRDAPHTISTYQRVEDPIASMADAYQEVINLVTQGRIEPPAPQRVDLRTIAAIVNGEEPLRGKPVVRFRTDEEIAIKRAQLQRM